MGDGTGDLALDQVGPASWGVVAGSCVPTHGAEIISELHGIATAAALVAAVDFSPAPMPLEDRDEVTFLRQLHFYIHEVETVLYRLWPHILEQGWHGFEQVVAFPPVEDYGQIIGP